MSERFMVDDAGTLIDILTRDMYDIVEEVCPVLNKMWSQTERFARHNKELEEENKSLKQSLDYEKRMHCKFKDEALYLQNRLDDYINVDNENEQLKTVIGRYDKSMNKKNDEINYAHLDILKLKEENEQLKQTIKKLEAQLYCTLDGVCDICKYHYLVPKEDYYISQCRKKHNECGKEDLKYCDDFELKGDVE